MNKAVTGKLGELAAGRYLRENGYEIIPPITDAVLEKLT